MCGSEIHIMIKATQRLEQHDEVTLCTVSPIYDIVKKDKSGILGVDQVGRWMDEDASTSTRMWL